MHCESCVGGASDMNTISKAEEGVYGEVDTTGQGVPMYLCPLVTVEEAKLCWY